MAIDYYNSLKKHKKIKIIKNNENLGFIKSINLALPHCTAKYLVILNNDTTVNKGWLENLAKGFEKANNVGIVAPLINCNNPYQNPISSKTTYTEAPYVYGTCFMIDRQLIKENILFDNIFGPGYFEDIDLCFKVIEAGYKILVAHNSKIHHANCGTFGAEKAAKLIKENYTAFYYRWQNTPLFSYLPKYLKFPINKKSFTGQFWQLEQPLLSLFFKITQEKDILKIKNYLDEQIYKNFNLIIYNSKKLEISILNNYQTTITDKDLPIKNPKIPSDLKTGKYLINFNNNNFYDFDLPEICVQILKNTQINPIKKTINNRAKKGPLFSFQCPAYDLRHIEETVTSVIQQTNKNWELLICFDNPPDQKKAAELVEKYKKHKKIKFFQNTRNLGVGPTRQILFSNSNSPYIIPLDSDDHVAPTLLAELKKEISKHKDFSLIRAGLRITSEIMSLEIIPEQRQKYQGFTIDIYNIYQPYLINAKHLKKIGGWHWNPEVLNACEDADIFIRLETLAPIYIIPKVLYFKRQHDEGLTKKMTGQLGLNSLFYSIELMLKNRKLKNLQFLSFSTINHDDKGITFYFHLKYYNIYTIHSFTVPSISDLNLLPVKKIKTSEIAEIFGNNSFSWQEFFLYANITLEEQITAPDIEERVAKSKLSFTKKYQFCELLEKYSIFCETIDIILLTSNDFSLTKRALAALYLRTRHPFNLIILNKNITSAKKSYYDQLQKKYKNIKIIIAPQTTSEIAFINDGLNNRQSRYVCLISDNIIISDNWLNKLKNGFIFCKEIGIVGPNYTDNFTDIKNKKKGQTEELPETYTEKNWLWDSCLLIKKTLLQKAGGLNKNFIESDLYTYFDFCFRARHNGYKILLANDCLLYKKNKPLAIKNLEKNYYVLKTIWQEHPLFLELPPEICLNKPVANFELKEQLIIEEKNNNKIKLAAIKIEQYANISHQVTDQDNLKYLSNYFEVILIKEEHLQRSLIDFFNFLTTNQISFIFLNITIDAYPLFTYRNDNKLPIGFIVWPYIFEPWRARYFRLAREAKNIDTFLTFSKYLHSSFQQISLNFDLLKMAGPINYREFPKNYDQSNELSLVYCGRLTPVKNLHVLLSLLGASKNAISFKLNIICPLENLNKEEKQYLALLHQTIERFNLKENIVFHGDLTQEKIKRNQILNESNVLVFLSTDTGETFGRAIVEGMAAGCAIITTNWQAVNELVIDGENGFTIDINNNIPDTQQLLSALILLSDNKTRQAMQKINRQKAKQYDYNQQIPKLVTYLKNKEPIKTAVEQIEKSNNWEKTEKELLAQLPEYLKEHRLELALAIDNIKKITDLEHLNYTHIYLGSEFCEELIPTKEKTAAFLNYCLKNKKRFILLTPPLTEKGLKKIIELLPLLPLNCEIVFNDWGLLSSIKKHQLTPRLGRLLLKVKREPRQTNNNELLKYLRTANLTEKIFQKYLLSNKINGIEFDNVWQGYDAVLPEDLSNSLYLPYVYITTTKKCLFKEKDLCYQHCQQKYITANLRNYDEPLLINGNTQFYTNTSLPDSTCLEKLKISRIVYQPKFSQQKTL